MKRIAFVTIAMILAGCASGPARRYVSTDMRECAQNMTVAGNVVTGTTYNTRQAYRGITKLVALQRATKVLTSEGYLIASVDKDLGLLSASQDVAFSEGHTAPMNIMVSSVDKGVDVGITMSTGVGQITSREGVKDTFCKIMAGIEGK